MTGLDRVIDIDAERGLVDVEAGIDWARLINHLLWTFPDTSDAWGIIQKQTGADRLTLGGALAANIHGRGLRLRPIVDDVESFTLVDAHGRAAALQPHRQSPSCSRSPIGGYGLFGADRAGHAAAGAAAQGRAPGDDRGRRRPAGALRPAHAGRLRVRRLPVRDRPRVARFPASRRLLLLPAGGDRRPIPDDQRSLSPRDWRRLLRLAHTDKSRAFAEYARYYMATDGQLYWSDTHQLADYLDGYHARSIASSERRSRAAR